MNRNERRRLAKQQKLKSGGKPAGITIDTRTLFAKAQRHFDAGQMAEAEQTGQKILGLNPVDSAALQLLGLIAYLGGEFDTAGHFLKKAITARPDFAEAYYNLGLTFNKQNKAPQAEKAYRRALTLEPGNLDCLNSLGNLLTGLNREVEALDIFQRALEIQPD